MQQTSPIIAWLRALARNLHAEVGGPGVGAVGMCFSAASRSAMMVDDIMLAPVLRSPRCHSPSARPGRPVSRLSPDDAAAWPSGRRRLSGARAPLHG